MGKGKLRLDDNQLKSGIAEKKEQAFGKLSIVKWVHDNSDKGLRDSKEFVDENIGNIDYDRVKRKVGIKTIEITLYFECDLTEEEIQEVLSEMYYEVKHKLISHTKIR